jgi:large subunit ribosomal protein L2
MALKSYKPTTPSQRQLVLVDRSALHKGKPVKALTEGKNATGGRNNNGRVTVRFRGGGHKQAYRIVDFKRRKFGVNARVERVEYDPNRTGFIALLKYDDGEQSYILAPQRLAEGDIVVSGEHVDVKPGNAMPLAGMPIGTIVHNVELKPGRGGQMVRGAGGSAQLMAKDAEWSQVRLPSGEVRRVLTACMATIGQVGNPEHGTLNLGKAGRSRWLGRRPTVRGSVMNPRDHPHGGGEGKAPIGGQPQTKWGKPAMGKKTRRRKDTDRFIVRKRGSK